MPARLIAAGVDVRTVAGRLGHGGGERRLLAGHDVSSPQAAESLSVGRAARSRWAVGGPGVGEVGALIALGLAEAGEPDSRAADAVLAQQHAEFHRGEPG
jgi:hypothetical protein